MLFRIDVYMPAPPEETRDPDDCLSKFMKQNINVIIYHSP